jgi:hypothetical protein
VADRPQVKLLHRITLPFGRRIPVLWQHRVIRGHLERQARMPGRDQVMIDRRVRRTDMARQAGLGPNSERPEVAVAKRRFRFHG